MRVDEVETDYGYVWVLGGSITRGSLIDSRKYEAGVNNLLQVSNIEIADTHGPNLLRLPQH